MIRPKSLSRDKIFSFYPAPLRAVQPYCFDIYLILSFQLHPGLQLASFPYKSPLKPCMHLSSPLCTTYTSHLVVVDFKTRIICGKEYRSCSVSLCSLSSLPCYLVPLRPKYLPQHSTFKSPQPCYSLTVRLLHS